MTFGNLHLRSKLQSVQGALNITKPSLGVVHEFNVIGGKSLEYPVNKAD